MISGAGDSAALPEVVDRFVRAAGAVMGQDPEALALLDGGRGLEEHNRLMAVHVQDVLSGRVAAGRAEQVGDAHVRRGLRPSSYLRVYNQVFASLHEVASSAVPPLGELRSRWLADACATLDAYHEALVTGWQQERADLHSDVTRLGHEAMTDDLTGVLNRRGFIRRLEQSRRAGCLLLLDLDGFKAYNDRAGHPAGDDVLRTLGRALLDLTRPQDVAGRIGGDEFAVWLEGGSGATADDLLARLRAVLPPGMGVSGGGATCTAGPRDFQQVHAIADAALYRHKRRRAGR